MKKESRSRRRGEYLFLWLVSLLVAVMLWVYVSNFQAPTARASRTVPVRYRNVPAGMEVVTVTPATAEVVVQGPKKVVDQVTGEDLGAYVDLTEAVEGENSLLVQVRTPAGVKLLQVNPGRVKVVLDAIDEVKLPVKVRLSGGDSSYRYIVTAVRPAEVTVRGPKRFLRQVEEVVAEGKVEKLDWQGEIEVPVTLRGGAGVENLSFSPRQVTVAVKAEETVATRKVLVKAALAGRPAAGWEVAAVEIQPATVTVKGPPARLNSLAEVTTEGVDVSGVTTDVVREVKLVLPEGIAAEETSVRVTVRVRPSSSGRQ